MAGTSTNTSSFEESIGDFSIDLGLGGSGDGESGTLDSPRKTSSDSISSISFGESYASMFGASCSSLCHSRWESSASEGESNNNSNIGIETPLDSNNNFPSKIDRKAFSQPMSANLCVSSDKKSKDAVHTRASRFTSFFGESLDDNGDEHQAVTLPTSRRAASEKSGLGESSHPLVSSFGTSCTSLLSCTWVSESEESRQDLTASFGPTETTTVVPVASKNNSNGDNSKLSGQCGNKDMMKQQQERIMLPPAPLHFKPPDGKKSHQQSSNGKMEDRRPPVQRNSSSLVPPRLPSRTLSPRKTSKTTLK